MTVGFLTVLALVGRQYTTQLEFFFNRVNMIDDRLAMASGTSDAPEEDEEDNFIVAQRLGVLRAFRDHPLIGIGWGGFADSDYSPTGHEVHSTPLRYLAELGVIGVILYGGFLSYLLFGSLKLFFLARKTPYQLSVLVLTIALWSLATSWAYNRHITERTFWLLLAVYASIETFLLNRPESTQASQIQDPQYAQGGWNSNIGVQPDQKTL